MDQLGHTDAAFTLRVYRHGMRRDERSKQALAQLVGTATVREAAALAAEPRTSLGRA